MAWFLVGGSSGGGFTLGPEQNVFTGADRAAAELARDNYFTANPSNLAAYNANTSLNIRLEYADGGDQVALYQVRNNAGDAWLDNQSFRGVQGEPGQNGTDGTALEFASRAERDTFFSNRPDLLRHNLPINVFEDGNTVTIELWTGATSPSTYNPATDAVLFIPASVRTSTGSLELGGVHTVSSGGENVFFSNNDSDVVYFPPWQSVGNHSDPNERVVNNRPSARQYGDLTFEETGGPVRSSGAVPYSVDVTLTRNESVFGIKIVAAETYQGVAEYRITRIPEEVVVYQARGEVDVTIDEEFELWFNYPVESVTGTSFRAEILKENGALGMVRPTQADDDPYVEIRYRSFTDVGMAFQSETGQADWSETDTESPSFIANKPTIPTPRTDEEIRDVVGATLVGGNGISIAVDDANNTITISAGGGPPLTGNTVYIDVTDDNLAASVDTSTAVSSNSLNPTVNLETFTGNKYVQILQSMSHTEFASIVIAGINQKGGFTINENARMIGGQQYRQYVTTNLITDALSGVEVVMTGAV